MLENFYFIFSMDLDLFVKEYFQRPLLPLRLIQCGDEDLEILTQ
jgi:hypothetical protein